MTTSLLLLVIKATVILIAALGVDSLLRKRNVLLCTAMWNAVLLALLVLPIAALALPAVQAPLLRWTPMAVTAPEESGPSRAVKISRAGSEELQGTSPSTELLITNNTKASPLPREMESPFGCERLVRRFTV